MVTICTASLTFNNSTFCPHTVFMCFVWIWEQRAIISLYSINCLVFKPRQSVFTARYELNIYVQFRFTLVFARLNPSRTPISTQHNLSPQPHSPLQSHRNYATRALQPVGGQPLNWTAYRMPSTCKGIPMSVISLHQFSHISDRSRPITRPQPHRKTLTALPQPPLVRTIRITHDTAHSVSRSFPEFECGTLASNIIVAKF